MEIKHIDAGIELHFPEEEWEAAQTIEKAQGRPGTTKLGGGFRSAARCLPGRIQPAR